MCLWAEDVRPEEGSGSPGTGLAVVMSHQMWVLGIELWSSAKASGALILCVISPTQETPFDLWR